MMPVTLCALQPIRLLIVLNHSLEVLLREVLLLGKLIGNVFFNELNETVLVY